MLGKKSTPKASLFAARVKRIAEAERLLRERRSGGRQA